MVLDAFQSGIFPLQPTECTGMLARVAEVSDHSSSSKQMFQRLLITLAQGKTSNTA